MMILVIGGSGSGKSSYAEDRITEAFRENQKGGNLYYIATMKVYGEEGKQRVSKHRKMRDGKGFITIEQTENLDMCIDKISDNSKENYVLLECLSNLAANEMFNESGAVLEDTVVEKIFDDVVKLKDNLEHLVIVSNNVFEDGCNYDEDTRAYIRALGRINRKLAEIADEVIEVVAGIPLKIK